MTIRSVHVFERHVNQIKEDIRSLVAELMKNESQLDCDRFPVKYLTCIKVEKEKAMEMWNEGEGGSLNWAAQTANAMVAKGQEKGVKRARDTNGKATLTTSAMPASRDYENEDEGEDESPIAKKPKGTDKFGKGLWDTVGVREDSGHD
jgi:hypothetical protein